MKVSQKATYALRAMLELARRGSGSGWMRSAQIASGAEIPEKYLEAIMVELSRAGLVESRRGPEGGHRLARAATTITAAEVVTAVEGPLKLTADAKPRGKGARELAESTAELWAEASAALRRVLEAVTLDELLRRAQTRRGLADFDI
ncbi:MAG: Rrf2 family transcriptional regulator [Deltaproteobacteria bacterium]|nr:Rrf2 family transcriptional regulator [Deltaproteobacteria bacterium]